MIESKYKYLYNIIKNIYLVVNYCIENDPTDSIDFEFFTNIVKELRLREPITLEKFKLNHHRTHTMALS